jgi:hypothetical protein
MPTHVTISDNNLVSDSSRAYGGRVIVKQSSIIHVIWRTNNDPNYVVRYAQSTDDGATWTDGDGGGSGTYHTVSDAGRDSLTPAIAIDSSDTVHVVWKDISSSPNSLYYRTRASNGTWSSIDTTSLVVASKNIHIPNIIVAPDDSLHIAGLNTTDNAVYWAYSTDGGSTWTVNGSLFTGVSTNPWRVGIDADSSNNLHLIWIKNSTNRASYAKATLSMGTWTWGSEDTTSLSDGFAQREPDILVDRNDDDVVAIWEVVFSGTSGRRLRWAKRPGATGSWSSQKNALFTATTSTAFTHPQLGYTSEGNFVVAFDIYRNSAAIFGGGFIVEDDSANVEAFHSTQTSVNVANVDLYDLYGENENLGTSFPSVARFSDVADGYIPAVFIDDTDTGNDEGTLKFTKFKPTFNIVHRNSTVVAGGVPLFAQRPLLRTDIDTFHLITRQTASPFEVRYHTSTDRGLTWTDGDGGASNSYFTLEAPASRRFCSSVAVDSDDDVYTVWSANTGTSALYFRRKISGTWQSVDSASLSVIGKNLRYPTIMLDRDENLHVFAKNETDLALYHAYSLDKGVSWTVAAVEVSIDFYDGEEVICADYDFDNNLHVVVNAPHNVETTDVPVYITAAFSGPSTWTWASPDFSSFLHPDLDQVAFTPNTISVDHNDPDHRIDLLWYTYKSASGEDVTTLWHGIIDSGIPSMTELVIYDDSVSTTVRPNPIGLGRDLNGHLYSAIAWVSPNSLIGLFGSVIKLTLGDSIWQGLSPFARESITQNNDVQEFAPITGNLYVVESRTATSGDDHKTVLFYPITELIATETTQTIDSDTVIGENPLKFLFSDTVISLVHTETLDSEIEIVSTRRTKDIVVK